VSEFEPKEHSLVYDETKHRVAEVMEVFPGWAALRKPEGGREWETALSSLRKPTAAETLSQKLAKRNEDSSYGGRLGA
jgi:hypothetical protein